MHTCTLGTSSQPRPLERCVMASKWAQWLVRLLHSHSEVLQVSEIPSNIPGNLHTLNGFKSWWWWSPCSSLMDKAVYNTDIAKQSLDDATHLPFFSSRLAFFLVHVPAECSIHGQWWWGWPPHVLLSDSCAEVMCSCPYTQLAMETLLISAPLTFAGKVATNWRY